MAPVHLDLLNDPWVRVLRRDGRVDELSMLEVFDTAHDLRSIVGEIPTQAAAVLRLHLAVMYRALRHAQDDQEARDEWGEWWESGRLPSGRIRDYLQSHEERFDLGHPASPFMQVADLSTATGRTSGLTKLIAEVPDGSLYFSTRSGMGLTSVPAAEAARWLVHLQAYDPSGIKSGAVGDPRVKGGKGYPIGIGWTGWLGLVVPECDTLAQTLLLNLVHDRPSPEGDAPVWEKPPHTAAPDPSSVEPGGPVQLLVWQPRRVRLIGDEAGRVVDALICNGDPIHARNRQSLEAGTAYRLSSAQTKKHGGAPVYMPLGHDPERQVWRGLEALLASDSPRAGEEAPRLAPPVLQWLARVESEGVLPPSQVVRIRAVGVEYGGKASVINGVTDDTLSVQAGVFSSPLTRQMIIRAVAATDRGVLALRNLASNLVLAAGGDPDGARARAGEAAYAALDAPFRTWLLHLLDDDAAEAVEQETRWHTVARRVLRDAAGTLLEEGGSRALRGRTVERRGHQPTRVDAGIAAIWFEAELARALDLGLGPKPGRATPTDREET